MTLDVAERNRVLDIVYPPTGTIGRIALISGTLVNTVATLNATTDIFTTTNTDPNYITGSRIRITTTGVLPSVDSGDPLSSGVDYFIIRIDDDEFKLARSLSDALANTPITFSDTGSGTHTFNEQELNFNDPLNVLINKELSHPQYTRRVLTDIGAASGGQKAITWGISIPGGGTTLSYKHKVLILGGSNTIGDTTGNKNHVFTRVSDDTINPGQSATLGVLLEYTNA